ncbi:MAG: c-type cytochrome [Acidobacteria bacterium]|nr:c-type cytochrome [Acidobacteriota bacterium]
MMLWLLLFALRVPLGLDTHIPVPDDNPLRAETVALGRKLFFEKQLSRDGTVACATCHDPNRAFTDEHPRAKGIGGQIGPRRSPRILNRAWGKSFFWDGRAATLEDQVVQPITNPLEMAMPLDDAVSRLAAMPAYNQLDVLTLRRALASYVRTILAGDSPYDRYIAGDRTALDAQQQKGLNLFRGKAGCISCHLGPNLTDEDFHVTDAGKSIDKGRNGAFKTPSLRQVAEAAPYFHDGSAPTLEAVIDHYDKGGTDPEMRPLRLAPDEKQAIVAFLKSLTGVVREGM